MLMILAKCDDAENVLGKTLYGRRELNIKLKKSTDVTNPSIPLATIAGVDYTDYSHVILPELGFTYFIRDWLYETASIVTLDCEIDYLETYKDKILLVEGLISRAVRSGDFGDLIPDVTGRVLATNYESDVELEPSTDSILSLINGEVEDNA